MFRTVVALTLDYMLGSFLFFSSMGKSEVAMGILTNILEARYLEWRYYSLPRINQGNKNRNICWHS